MRTLAKAMMILDLFSEARPAWRLSEIADATGLDRSTAHRMLKTMLEFGYVSHERESKRYQLGATIQRLARTREAVVATAPFYREILEALTQQTHETSHASLVAGFQIATIAVCEGHHMTRVVVEAGGRLDLHATASGLVCLAYGTGQLLERILSHPLPAYGPATPLTAVELERRLAEVCSNGYALADGTFDPEVFGIAAPIFGHEQTAVGAIAVASPFSRVTPDRRLTIARATVEAGLRASAVEAGNVPRSYLETTRDLLS